MINPAIPKAPLWKRIWFFFFLPLALRDMQEWIEYRKRECTREGNMILDKKCDLTYNEALDVITTIIGMNWEELQQPMSIEVRDRLAKTIADNLFNPKTKKLY